MKFPDDHGCHVDITSDSSTSNKVVETPRFLQAIRNQVRMVVSDLESTIPDDHPVRLIWSFVAAQDLTPLYDSINAVEGGAGRSPIDPRILMALWLYATTRGIGSAREIDRQCRENIVYQWICGEVSVNYHTLSDFRKDHAEVLNKILTLQVATLVHEGLVDLDEVSIDGVRIRAHAGSSSFHRRKTLESCLAEAHKKVEELAQEVDSDSKAVSQRVQSARRRAVREREERLKSALERMTELEAKKNDLDAEKLRASSTDPDATKMRMGDGGFRPAYNIEIVADTRSKIILGLDVIRKGTDRDQFKPMIDQLLARYGRYPLRGLVDAGFRKAEDLDLLAQTPYGIEVYCPVYQPKNSKRDPYLPLPTDSALTAALRIRMGTPEGREIYKRRASTSELDNGRVRNHGLYQLLVRGVSKAIAVILWHAIAINISETNRLRKARMAIS